MIEERFRENKTSSRGMYIRNTSDIPTKWKDIRSSYIPTNWDDMRSTADINKLSAMLLVPKVKEAVANLYQNIEKGRIR